VGTKLLFLHGPPAAGKLTVAKAVLRYVPGRLFDNHVAIDVARTVFEFGTPGFWELVHAVRCSVLEAAARAHVPLVVATYCYAEPDDRAAIAGFEAILARHGGRLLPVFLQCSREELLRRVANADRRQRGKVTSATGLDEFVAQFNITRLPHADCQVLDSERSSAEANALEIVRRFALVPDQPADFS
jgi:shikimate kinase